jgi:hypothetical protein
MFIEFSGRFQQLLRMFPTEALANLTPTLPVPPPSRELTECAMYCMHFVADVYYLHRGGYVSAKLCDDHDVPNRETVGRSCDNVADQRPR